MVECEFIGRHRKSCRSCYIAGIVGVLLYTSLLTFNVKVVKSQDTGLDSSQEILIIWVRVQYSVSTRSLRSRSSPGWPINGPQAQGFHLPIVGLLSSWIRYLCLYPTSTSTSSSAFSPQSRTLLLSIQQFGDGQGAVAIKLSRSRSRSQLWTSRS